MAVRPYTASDLPEWKRMRTALWPDQTEADMAAWLGRADAATFVADIDNRLHGFAEASIRPYVDGCDTAPVAYLEGWYVDPENRRRGLGAALVQAVEAWARARGIKELASDATLDNALSHRAHRHLGFAEVGRFVLYRKPL